MREQDIEATRTQGGISVGPLGFYVDSFIAHLVSLGYTRATIRNQRSRVRGCDRWLSAHHVPLAEVGERVTTFLDARESRGRPRGSAATLGRLLTYLRSLRSQGAIGTPVVVAVETPLAQLEHRYQDYLHAARGLSPTTVRTDVGFLRQFVMEHGGDGAASVGPVSASDVAAFVQRHARAGSPGRAQLMTPNRPCSGFSFTWANWRSI